MADCYYVAKAYNDSLTTYYKRAIALNSFSDNDYADFQAGNILGIQRKYPEAKSEFDQVIEIPGFLGSWITLGFRWRNWNLNKATIRKQEMGIQL
ncbi:MAG: hypothetical protein QM734_13900 [Cyclobacteriaceae bacterium]